MKKFFHYRYASLFLLIFGVSPLFAQFKNIDVSPSDTEQHIKIKPKELPQHSLGQPGMERPAQWSIDNEALVNRKTKISATHFDQGLPIFFRGYHQEQKGKTINQQIESYLTFINKYYKLPNFKQSYRTEKIEIDELGMHHIQVDQVHKGGKVEGKTILLHATNGIINRANGRFSRGPFQENEILITADEALNVVINEFKKQKIYKERIEEQAFLLPDHHEHVELLYAEMEGRWELCYKVTAHANVMAPYIYYVHPSSGEILHHYKNACGLHDHGQVSPPDGPAVATAKDLANVDRTINTYEFSGSFYMIDASRDMFNNGASNFPNEPVGVIWTIDAFNTHPNDSDFGYDHVTSSNNTWNNKTAVSAHYNGGEAYEYFKNTHNRNSINGEGGNIISLINISDPESGGGFDNAFWNGAAMFYGNGDVAFDPLAEGLDVAGHEMSHGVIQATANLTYQGESGALNESFADIFGAMIDRDDWFIGEDVAKTAVFPTGRMRDMSDPHNGGNQLGDPGWQPNNVSEQFTGPQDNGGVHINSGIINFAYYQFAENAAVGKDKAEDVFYRALTKYLTKSSNFKDMRAAAEQAAEDLFDQSVKDAVSSAFANVGIGTGGGQTDYETEVETNPGEDFLLHSDNALSNLFIRNNSLELIADPLTNDDHRSRPSVTDDGSVIFYVGSDNNIKFITIDWNTGQTGSGVFDDQGVWRNVVISKDGRRLAAITEASNNLILIYDFDKQEQQIYELFNPTFTEGVSSGNVDFADAMEFDFTGEWLMYDAQSTINGNQGDIVYWDIGFLNVWNNATNNFASGEIQKLFSQLPENTSVGNPTFSKNSPHIIAFDMIENNTYKIIGANVEANQISEIFENGGLGYPNFNNQDNQLVYQFEWIFGVDIGLIALEADKITPVFNSDNIIVETSRLPVVFANGERQIVSNKATELVMEWKVFPNPSQDLVNVSWDNLEIQELQIFDAQGRLIKDFNVLGMKSKTISITDLNKGSYVIRLLDKEGQGVDKTLIKAGE